MMDRSQLAPIIIGKLLNIGGMLERYGNRVLLPFGLNQQQFSIFFEIAKAGKVRQKDMVNRLCLEKAHVSKIVKKLLGMDLIASSPSDDDKRSFWLSPTPKGKKTLKKCRGIFEVWNRDWMGSMSEKELVKALESLDQLQAVFRSRIKPE